LGKDSLNINIMKKKQLIAFLICCMLITCTHASYGQEEVLSDYKANTIHGSLGTLLLIGGSNIFYDRFLGDNTKHKNLATFVRIGYQRSSVSTDFSGGISKGNGLILEAGMLTGRNFSHFEAALGATYLDNFNNKKYFLPAFSLAYRGQKPGNSFMFRTGVGFPEYIFIGLGFSF
jgi:hypothetical protein